MTYKTFLPNLNIIRPSFLEVEGSTTQTDRRCIGKRRQIMEWHICGLLACVFIFITEGSNDIAVAFCLVVIKKHTLAIWRSQELWMGTRRRRRRGWWGRVLPFPFPENFQNFIPEEASMPHFRAFAFLLLCVISPNSVALGADYVKVVDDELIMSATKI